MPLRNNLDAKNMHAKEVLSLESQANPTVLYVTVVIVQHTPLSTGHVTGLTSQMYITVPDLKKLHVFLLSSFYSCDPLQEDRALESG